MEEELQLPREEKTYKFKTAKVERILSMLLLVIFIMSFKSGPLTVVFYILTFAILAYYFVWFRKKPIYVKVLGNEITVSEGIFLKPFTFEKEIIGSAVIIEKKLVITLNTEVNKQVKINPYFLEDMDYKEILKFLNLDIM